MDRSILSQMHSTDTCTPELLHGMYWISLSFLQLSPDGTLEYEIVLMYWISGVARICGCQLVADRDLLPAPRDTAGRRHVGGCQGVPGRSESTQNQAPGYFHFNILRGLYWKIVPFLHRWIQPVISTRRSRYVRISLAGAWV